MDAPLPSVKLRHLEARLNLNHLVESLWSPVRRQRAGYYKSTSLIGRVKKVQNNRSKKLKNVSRRSSQSARRCFCQWSTTSNRNAAENCRTSSSWNKSLSHFSSAKGKIFQTFFTFFRKPFCYLYF